MSIGITSAPFGAISGGSGADDQIRAREIAVECWRRAMATRLARQSAQRNPD